MTAVTFVRCFAVFLFIGMTTGARSFAVLSAEFEIREMMVKGQFVHLDDVGLAALVFAMTALAFLIADDRIAAVITGFILYVLTDFLMAVQALVALFFSIEFFVAVFAGVFVFCVAFNYFTGHDQRFN